MEPPKPQEIRKMLQIGAVLLGIVSLAYYIKDDPEFNRRSIEETPEPVKIASKSTSIEFGDEVFINTEDFAGVTEEDCDVLLKAFRAKDNYGVAELINQGRVFKVTPNTKAKVIGRTITLYELRILEGNNQGKSGFLPVEYVSK